MSAAQSEQKPQRDQIQQAAAFSHRQRINFAHTCTMQTQIQPVIYCSDITRITPSSTESTKLYKSHEEIHSFKQIRDRIHCHTGYRAERVEASFPSAATPTRGQLPYPAFRISHFIITATLASCGYIFTECFCRNKPQQRALMVHRRHNISRGTGTAQSHMQPG